MRARVLLVVVVVVVALALLATPALAPGGTRAVPEVVWVGWVREMRVVACVRHRPAAVIERSRVQRSSFDTVE